MSDLKTYKDRWEKIDDIDGGGQGTTIKAVDKNDNNVIAAVKILNKQNDMERRARMLRETVSLSTLSHPNLPEVLDSNTENWQDLNYKLFIATEFIPGVTLSKYDFSNETLQSKIDFIKVICRVINYCHQRGTIHRDIKPDNIILKDNSLLTPFVIDFGLSFNFNDKDDDNLTSDGQHLGNRFLILPEQKTGEAGKRDFRTDVTCIVGLFYFILTNQIPTIALDEYNQKPHQRSSAKTIIDTFPKHQRDIINDIFDVGFNQLIEKRWNSASSLIEQFEILEKSEPTEMQSAKNIVDLIKSSANKQEYQDTKFAKQLYSTVDKTARAVLEELRRELGDDWGYSQSGGNLNGELAYKNMLAPVNTVNPSLNLNTHIYAFITGSELVIQIIEGESKSEVFRQPALGDIQWGQFKDSLKSHYLNEIAKKI